ncbi:nuclear exosome regulator NRDE2 isoform X2 [Pipistrellus kuhlii]|uniref:Nuclear exosome regulator NRDE2 n=1 Tax=Pipistrellus kuhlii TaxID=59472 RepID=A0A7J8B370_PIPKU|nr:nuclear exosome regulator NRDE2 isoform X2 [Pipistrellus kuhlii]KAF6393082.1 NRDE-2, necessary for RNA interference, domain containing [Pipistrellus kuhlii]
MALFPAFAGVSEAPDSGSARKELDWLSNPSFCVETVTSLSQQAEEAAALVSEESLLTRSPLKSELSDESDSNRNLRQASRKKKKEKRKKRKHQHHKKTKRKRGQSSSSGSEPDTDSDKDKSPRGLRGGNRGLETLSQDNAAAAAGPRCVWLEDIQALTGETFRTDKKPDPANWEYKSLYRGDIARYKRKGDSCLGINPKKQCISWEGAPTEKKRAHKHVERYFTKKNVGLMSADGVAVSSKADPPSSAAGSFIPVKDSDDVVPPVTTWLNPLGIYDQSTTHWLQGQGPTEQESKQPDSQPDHKSSLLKARVEEFNRRVRENPRDTQLWMAFVAFQDEVMRSPGLYAIEEGEQEKRKRSLKLILEKKLAILERAIDSNPSSVDLKLAKLKLCAEFWEPSTLVKEWQKLIFLHPNNTALWQKYLLFCQSQFSTFSISKIHSLYGKCLSTLSAVKDGSILSHPELPGTEEAMFALFLQQCHFLRQAGHAEKAVSLFQAMVDFTFFKPDSVKDLPARGQVEFFEPFWDSGEPRAGEKGARGWRAWMHQQERGGWVVINPDEDDDEPEEDDQDIRDKTLPKWQIWLAAERSRDQRHWRPWRPDKTKKQTEEDCEDPERQVLFDDIGQSLIRLSSQALQFQLIVAFLQFLGVPAGFSPPASCLYLAMDENSVFDNVLYDEQPLTSPNLSFSGVSCVGRTDQLGCRRWTRGHSREGEEFIRNLFHLVMPLFSGPERSQLCSSWLRYEIAKVIWCLHTKNKKRLKSRGKNCKKLAKNLLKEPENRNNVCLWKQYAHLEWLLGNTEDARKVFDTALSSAGSRELKDPEVCELSLLYAALELELAPDTRVATTARAVHILTRLAESGPYGPYTGQVLAVHILKARKAYEHALQDCLGESCVSDPAAAASLNRLVSVVKCFMLFQYLTTGIDAAVQIHEQVFAKLKGALPAEGPGLEASACPPSVSVSSVLEAVTLMHTSLLRFHMKVSVYPLAPLRQALSEALRLYPGNQVLWRSYVQIQSKSHSANRTRRFFDAVTRSAKPLEPWLFAIEAEKMRKRLVETVQRVDGREVYATIPETGLTHRIRALFENAIRSEHGSQCPLLWRMYLSFLVSLGNKDRSKGVFYKALQSCPWAKALYMDAVEYFPDEMQEILDLMTEKELRVRLPLEELELLLED